MKKLLAFVALVLACTASMKAQVKVTCNGKEVATNDTVTFYADVDEGDGSGEVLVREPMIVNTGDEAVDLKVTVVIDRKLASEKCFRGAASQVFVLRCPFLLKHVKFLLLPVKALTCPCTPILRAAIT